MQKALRGRMAYMAGEAAEQCVARDYERRGFSVARRRWRGPGGEIDLITRDGDGLVFVEVKQSRDFARAAERVSRRQMDRICASAEQFLAGEPAGSLSNVRFDVALVNGAGAVRIIENAFGLA
ncbi:MAG: YraN family protein [Jhaorihella sp.]